jgi:CRP/FNR family transcriptional regulator
MEPQLSVMQSGGTMTTHAHPHGSHPLEGSTWSTMEHICALLHIHSISAASENCLFQHMQCKPGQRVHGIGQALDTLYIVNAGFLKTVLGEHSGHKRVLSFPMKGDVLGVDGIDPGSHATETVALSECDLILLPFERLKSLGRANPDIETLVTRMMSRELAGRHALIDMLGTLSAEARLARFLVALSERHAELGYSGKRFNLRMTRQEIGSYLGLTLETVSRTLSVFNDMELTTVRQRSVEINNPKALRTLCRLPPLPPPAR